MALKKEDLPKVIVLVLLILFAAVYAVMTVVKKNQEASGGAPGGAAAPAATASAGPAAGSPAGTVPGPSGATSTVTPGKSTIPTPGIDPSDPRRFYGAGPKVALRDPFVSPTGVGSTSAPSGKPGQPGPTGNRGVRLAVGGPRRVGGLPVAPVEFFDPATGAPLTAQEAKGYNGFVVSRRGGLTMPGTGVRVKKAPSIPDRKAGKSPSSPPSPGGASSQGPAPKTGTGPAETGSKPTEVSPPEPVLAGTIQGPVPMAVIRFGGTTKRYIAKVGDWLEGAYEVTDISSARVVLRAQNGRSKVLALGGRPDAS